MASSTETQIDTLAHIYVLPLLAAKIQKSIHDKIFLNYLHIIYELEITIITDDFLSNSVGVTLFL